MLPQISVLIIDDDPAILFALEFLFKDELDSSKFGTDKIEVFKAPDVDMALQLLHEEKSFDLVLTDLRLNDDYRSGIDIVKEIRYGNTNTKRDVIVGVESGLTPDDVDFHFHPSYKPDFYINNPLRFCDLEKIFVKILQIIVNRKLNPSLPLNIRNALMSIFGEVYGEGSRYYKYKCP